jgi:hypothetical protein
LKNLVVLVAAAAYFAADFLGQQMKLRTFAEKLLIVSQRFTGTHPSAFTRLADGIRRLLSRSALPATTGIAPETTVGIGLRLLSPTILGKVLEIFV